MVSEQLRQLAQELRKTAAAVDTEKMVKCAQTLLAARALHILREKVRPNV